MAALVYSAHLQGLGLHLKEASMTMLAHRAVKAVERLQGQGAASVNTDGLVEKLLRIIVRLKPKDKEAKEVIIHPAYFT
jgi:hypothetical protein